MHRIRVQVRIIQVHVQGRRVHDPIIHRHDQEHPLQEHIHLLVHRLEVTNLLEQRVRQAVLLILLRESLQAVRLIHHHEVRHQVDHLIHHHGVRLRVGHLIHLRGALRLHRVRVGLLVRVRLAQVVVHDDKINSNFIIEKLLLEDCISLN